MQEEHPAASAHAPTGGALVRNPVELSKHQPGACASLTRRPQSPTTDLASRVDSTTNAVICIITYGDSESQAARVCMLAKVALLHLLADDDNQGADPQWFFVPYG